MGLLSASVTIARYLVDGKVKDPFFETVQGGLTQHSFRETEGGGPEKAVGWTPFQAPFVPDFEAHSCVIGSHLLFCLRIDKKTLPPKVVKKHVALETAKRLRESGRDYLAREEKRMVREAVESALLVRIPAIPNLYEVLWHYDSGVVWFFSTQSAAREELETLFSRSFQVRLISLFPFTMADLTSGLGPREKDALMTLRPALFVE